MSRFCRFSNATSLWICWYCTKMSWGDGKHNQNNHHKLPTTSQDHVGMNNKKISWDIYISNQSFIRNNERFVNIQITDFCEVLRFWDLLQEISSRMPQTVYSVVSPFRNLLRKIYAEWEQGAVWFVLKVNEACKNLIKLLFRNASLRPRCKLSI